MLPKFKFHIELLVKREINTKTVQASALLTLNRTAITAIYPMAKVLCLNLRKQYIKAKVGCKQHHLCGDCGIADGEPRKCRLCLDDSCSQISPVRAKSPLTSTLLFLCSSSPYWRRGLCSWRVQAGSESTSHCLLARTPKSPSRVLVFLCSN